MQNALLVASARVADELATALVRIEKLESRVAVMTHESRMQNEALALVATARDVDELAEALAHAEGRIRVLESKLECLLFAPFSIAFVLLAKVLWDRFVALEEDSAEGTLDELFSYSIIGFAFRHFTRARKSPMIHSLT